MKAENLATPNIIISKKDPDSPDILWRQEWQFGVEIAWIPLLYAAAEALVTAIGSKIGEAIGNSLADALVGNNNKEDAFRAEVIARLTRIEQKLDDVIRFIRVEFPEMTRELLREEFIQAARIQLQVSKSGIERAIVQLPHTGVPTDAQLASLEMAAENAAQAGEALLLRGQGCYLSGVHAMASLISAYSRLAKYDRNKLKSLGATAARFSTLITPWISAANLQSYTSLLAQFEQELLEAKKIRATLPTDMLMVAVSPITWGGPGLGDPNTAIPAGSATFGYVGEFRINEDGTLADRFLDGELAKQIQPAVPDPIDLPELAAKMGVAMHDWWLPPILPSWQIRSRADVARQGFIIAETAVLRVNKYPPIIEELTSAIRCITELKKCCDNLASLR